MIRFLKSGCIAVGVLVFSETAAAEPSYRMLDFADLEGWSDDDQNAALGVFLNTCKDMKSVDWLALCRLAKDQTNGRKFFELFFRPILIEDGSGTLFTGYFEPELFGSRTKTVRYRYPVYKMPPEAKTSRPWHTRKEIESDEVITDPDLIIAYVDNPVDLFFLQIQGSGRIKLPNGRAIRVGYGGFNGHNYRSVGTELVRRGELAAHQASAKTIRRWVANNPEEGRKLLWHNPSYVFFREVSEVPSDRGPLGAMNRSITAGRSIAVDPKYVSLGAPVWVEKDGRKPMNRLMVAQDTGSKIKGAQRADLFIGTGESAGLTAGQIKNGGRMVVLIPIQRAYALLPEEF